MNKPFQAPAYDAFGDQLEGVRVRDTGTHRARSAVVAIFWSVAMLLVAGRVYQQNALIQPHAIEMTSR